MNYSLLKLRAISTIALTLLLSASSACFGMGCAGVKREQLEKQMDRLTKRLSLCDMLGFRNGKSYPGNEWRAFRGTDLQNRKPKQEFVNNCDKIFEQWVKLGNELYPDREKQ